MSFLPWFLPGVALTLVVATTLALPFARALPARTAVAWLLLAALGTIAAATLTPSRLALDYGTLSPLSCDLSRVTLAPLRELRRIDDTSLNILLFIPLGTAVGLLPRSRARAAILVGTVALPPAIEATQLLVPALDRACQSADVVDNLTGLALGLMVGSVAALVGRRVRRER